MPKQTKYQEETLEAWIRFWRKRWSVFLKNYTTPFVYSKDNERTNLFFSINGYREGKKDRSDKNILSYNAFYFDIDLQDNPWLSKTTIQSTIMSHSNLFDLVVESRNGFHLYIMLDLSQYKKKDKDQYLWDWKERAEELENILDLKFDHNCFDTTRISRIPWSFHHKPSDLDCFSLKLLHWEKLLFPKFQTIRKINYIPITNVLEVLWIKYEWETILENWKKTNGYRINYEKNYINDFSNKWRPIWEPFSFVKSYYKLQETNQIWDIAEQNSIIKTYRFFKEKFGIIGEKDWSNKIVIKEYIEKFLVESNLSGKELQLILSLMFFYQMQQDWGFVYWKNMEIEANYFLKTCNLNFNVTYLKTIISSIKNMSLQIKFEKKFHNFLDIDILKKDGKCQLKYTILPNRDGIKNSRELFITHYISTKALQIPTNWSMMKFYLHLGHNLLHIKKVHQIEEKKNDICKIFHEHNFTRVKSKIQKISQITQDFELINISWKVVSFKKK